MLPMGYPNSMQEFQRSTCHIVEGMTKEKANVFVDDIRLKGLKICYNNQPIPENPSIRCFVWEYTYECLALLITAGVTASRKKFILVMPRVMIVRYECDLDGMKPHHGIIIKVQNWPVPENTTQVRGFLGTVRVARNLLRRSQETLNGLWKCRKQWMFLLILSNLCVALV